MKEEVKILALDRAKQGLTLTALVEYRNMQIRSGKDTGLADEVIQDIFKAKSKRKKIKEIRDVR